MSGAPALPRGATDAHVHVFDAARFPFAGDVTYRPQPHECGTVTDLAATLDSHGVDRVVIVNPTSGYRDDLRCLLDALRRLGERARGVARGPLDVSARDLARWKARGVVGFRVDVVGDGLPGGAPALRRLATRLADADLVLDLQCEGDQLADLAPLLVPLPVRVVVDHAGRPVPARGVAQPGFRALLDAVARGRCWVKLSGPLRFSRRRPPHADVDRFAARLLAHGGPGRLVWGSDWPFLRSDRRVDYGPLLALLERWVPDAAQRRRILVDTPADLFGFPPARPRRA
ncbi:MAG: 2-pyrone-4,6-dicarboxylate hydrolase [Betaproteobacteria bacterium]|nr:MAG: 2-pyrone-4,6-dicarboxylate hydrolase [Betaproteobacteria bacterium]